MSQSAATQSPATDGTPEVPKGCIEVRSCQVCGGQQATPQFSEPPYTVVRCDDCGLVWVTPRWNDEAIHEVYNEDYWRSDQPKTKGYADYASEAELYLKTFRRRVRFVRRYLPTGRARILDVGCAAGFFLRVMKEQGHEVRGVEISTSIAGEARRALGDDAIHVGTLDSVPQGRAEWAPGSFDLVTMWDVIEHVTDPQQLLREARAMLKPGGHLILETQNVDSRFASLLGPKWHHYKHEEHIYHFNPSTVQKVLEQSGFEMIKRSSAFGGKYVSFGFIAERAARLNKLASLALKPLAAFRRANIYLNFHDEMVVVAKPSGS